MKTISKKLFCLLMVVIMVASVIPFQAFAELTNNGECPLTSCDGHVEWIVPKAATCTEDGYEGYYHCNKCKSNFNASGSTTINVLPAKHTPGTKVNAKLGDCQTVGTKEYIPCKNCDARQVDGEWTTDPAKWMGTLGDHVAGTSHDAVPATCVADGVKAYTECTKCDYIKVDGSWIADTSKLVEPASADAHVEKDYVPEVAATCTATGTKAYITCANCTARKVDGVWTKDSKKWTLSVSSTGHVDGTAYDEVPATCTEDGTKAYTACAKCSARWVPEIGWTTNSTDWTIPATGHSYATKVEGGNDVDCYKVKCNTCKKYFACDVTGCVTDHTPLTDGHAPHTPVDDVCTVCGNGMPKGENIKGEFEVLIKYVNAAGQEIKAEKVYPVCVIMRPDDKYIDTDKVLPGTGFIVPADPTAELRFSTKDFFDGVHPQDDNGQTMLLNEADKVIAVRRNQRNVVTVKVKYDPSLTVTVKFYRGTDGKFTGTNKSKAMVAYDVPYGSPLPTPPVYEGNDDAHRAMQKWSTDPSGYPIYNYKAGGASNLLTDLELYAVYDATAATNATLNIVFYGTDVTTTVKTLTGLDASDAIGTILKKAKLKQIIEDYGFGFELVSDRLYSNTSGSVYEAKTTVSDVNKANGYVYINVKPNTFTATFYGSDGVVDGLIANSDYKVLKDLKYGQTKIEMPIPVATTSGHTFYGWREQGGEIYKFEPNTKLTFTYNYNRDTFFEPIWNTSSGVFVNIYFNNITNRSLYTVEIHDVQDTLTVNQVLSLLSRYFTWSDFRGLYTNEEWVNAVKNNFATGAGTKSVDGVSVILDKDRNEYNLMLLGAKQNGILISNANLSTIGIGVNANGAYAPADPTNPKTGNEAQMLGVAMASMVMAVITLGGVTYYTRKKEEMI